MKPVSTITVVPSLPKALEDLERLAYNIRWAWDPDHIELFRRIDRNLWEDVYHNPIQLLGKTPQTRLDELAEDPGFIAHLKRVSESLRSFLGGSTWFKRTHKTMKSMRVAYFSAEFGLSEALPIYSGGLGILAGDHLKSANVLGLPLVGVGLLYQMGYFRQYLNTDGRQQEDVQENDFHTMPLKPVESDQGVDLTISLNFPEGKATAKIWKVEIGRNPLYLLDTNLVENPPEIREVTSQLYGGMKKCVSGRRFFWGSVDCEPWRPLIYDPRFAT